MLDHVVLDRHPQIAKRNVGIGRVVRTRTGVASVTLAIAVAHVLVSFAFALVFFHFTITGFPVATYVVVCKELIKTGVEGFLFVCGLRQAQREGPF